MKTRTLVSLVFGLALLGSVSVVTAGETILKASSQPAAAPVKPAAASTNVPVELPETASVVVLPQPIAQLPEGVALSGWVGELVKLAEAGIGQDVLLSFVDSAGTFNLGANQIIYLHDIGIPSEVITAIIQHDADIASGLRQVTAGAPPMQLSFQSERSPVSKQSAPPPQPLRSRPAPEYLDSTPEWPWADQLVFAEPFDFFEDWAATDEITELSPVRKPYAVQLTSPILVWPIQGRMPNVTFLRTLP